MDNQDESINEQVFGYNVNHIIFLNMNVSHYNNMNGTDINSKWFQA